MNTQTRRHLQEAPASPHRNTARTVGIIYLAGMVLGVSANLLILSILSAPDRLVSISQNSMLLSAAILCWLLTVVGDLAHGILMYPVLREKSERMAVGYLGFRIVDATFIAIMALVILAQIPLAREAASSDTALLSLSTVFMSVQLYAYSIAMLTLGISGLILCSVLQSQHLLPRALTIWGLVGYAIILVGSALEVLGFDLVSTHAIPGGLWEVFVGVWLIAKGFSGPRGRSEPIVQGSTAPAPQPITG